MSQEIPRWIYMLSQGISQTPPPYMSNEFSVPSTYSSHGFSVNSQPVYGRSSERRHRLGDNKPYEVEVRSHKRRMPYKGH